MPAATVTIGFPNPGSSIPSAAPASPGGHMTGTYTLDNAPFNKVVCRIIFPATTGLPASQLVIERVADNPSPGTWRVDFGALPQGLDSCMQAELYVGPNPNPNRVDTDTIEDVDILDAIIGTLNVPVPIPLPIPTIP